MFLISEHVGVSMRMVAIVSSVIFFFMMLPLATKVKEHNVELKNTEDENAAEHCGIADDGQRKRRSLFLLRREAESAVSECALVSVEQHDVCSHGLSLP